MAHNELNAKEVEEQYPSLEAVDDLELNDLSRRGGEQFYKVGMNIVQGIPPQEMGVNG